MNNFSTMADDHLTWYRHMLATGDLHTPTLGTILALIDEVERLRGERAWQSIETAPRDREVLVAFRATGYVATAIFKSQEGAWLYFNDYHDDGELRSCDDCDLSGWMPLPKPPAVSRGTGEGGA